MSSKELFKLISVLLQYPQQDMFQIDIKDLVKDLKDKEVKNNLLKFGEYFTNTSLRELQEKYVETFDFNDKTTMFLTYPKLKDAKERGQILVELKMIYQKENLYLNGELPDYLPVFLEFVSISKNDDLVIDLLYRFKGSIEHLYKKLIEENSPYAYLIEALLLEINNFISKGHSHELRKSI